MYKLLKDRYKPERQWPGNRPDPFPVEGDHIILQFVNTYRNRGCINRKDYFENYNDFLDWCAEFRVVSIEEYNGLNLEAYCYESEANLVWQRVIKLRETVYEFINSPLRGKEIHEDAVSFFNELLNEANAHLRLELVNNSLTIMWFNIAEELPWPLWTLVKRAAMLMLSLNFKDIKKCKCGKFYLDTTRNKNRRWCNPLVCGNAARSKKYKERKLRAA